MDNAVLLEDLEYIYNGLESGKKLKNSTILITGCAGFIGFYLMNFFCRYADSLKIKSIIGLDNFLLGRPEWLKRLSSEYKGKVDISAFDIAKDDLLKVKNAENADFIIHMASVASPTFYRKYPVETIDANVWGLRKLLDFYRTKHVRCFLFFSSSEVYGDPEDVFIPTREDYRGNVSQIGPRACYDEAKRFGETLCYTFAEKYGMPIVIVRPFNNYGPGMRLNDKRVPSDFARAVFENKDIVIHSDGAQTRTFCYASDALVGYLRALLYGKFEYFNIGINKPEITVQELAEIYAETGRDVLGYTGSIKHEQSSDKDYLINSPSRRCPNIDKARELLNYRPSIGVKEGVRRYLEFVKTGGGKL